MPPSPATRRCRMPVLIRALYPLILSSKYQPGQRRNLRSPDLPRGSRFRASWQNGIGPAGSPIAQAMLVRLARADFPVRQVRQGAALFRCRALQRRKARRHDQSADRASKLAGLPESRPLSRGRGKGERQGEAARSAASVVAGRRWVSLGCPRCHCTGKFKALGDYHRRFVAEVDGVETIMRWA